MYGDLCPVQCRFAFLLLASWVFGSCESRLDAVRELNAHTRQSNESAEQVSLIIPIPVD
jgi:hypothetical protein